MTKKYREGAMKEVASNISIIDTKAFGQEKIIASYLVRGKNKTALIDPGFPSSAPVIKAALKQHGIEPAQIDHVLLTHFHLDHSGGTGALIQSSPRTTVMIHKRAAFYVRNFGKIVGGARMVFRPEIIRKFGDAVPVPHDAIRSLSDGDRIDLGGGTVIRVIHTPGHCGDEVSFFEECSGAIITGDVAGLQYPWFDHVPIPAGSPPLFDLNEEIASLNSLRSIPARKILIPHYGEIDSPWTDYLDRNIEAIESMKRTISEMFQERMEFPQMVERMRQDLIVASGKAESEIPEFVSKIYIREMLKTGLMGFLAYMLEYAPYPRAFTSEICAPLVNA
jgi:glyoxylase-like metal-dependent hydrolase (beta-lactamase superfamily II)